MKMLHYVFLALMTLAALSGCGESWEEIQKRELARLHLSQEAAELDAVIESLWAQGKLSKEKCE